MEIIVDGLKVHTADGDTTIEIKKQTTPYTAHSCDRCTLKAPSDVAHKKFSLTWDPNKEKVDCYNLYIERSTGKGKPFASKCAVSVITLGDVTSCSVTGLDSNTVYHFALTAKYGCNESGFSEIVTVIHKE